MIALNYVTLYILQIALMLNSTIRTTLTVVWIVYQSHCIAEGKKIANLSFFSAKSEAESSL
jgi:hypothetical protein